MSLIREHIDEFIDSLLEEVGEDAEDRAEVLDQVRASLDAVGVETYTYRFFLDVAIVANDEPDLDKLGDQAAQLARGLADSDAFPNPVKACTKGASFSVTNYGVLPGMPVEDPL